MEGCIAPITPIEKLFQALAILVVLTDLGRHEMVISLLAFGLSPPLYFNIPRETLNMNVNFAAKAMRS